GEPGTAGGAAEIVYVVTIVNTGSEAATVWDVGLDRRDGQRINSARAINLNANAESRLEGPSLPARIEPHGTLTWRFLDAVTSGYRNVEIVGWVSQYRPIRWWHSKRAEPFKRRASTRSRTRA
ncbi:hypothetical protein AB4Z22_39555, partial [Paenibacillus sp. TAF58]